MAVRVLEEQSVKERIVAAASEILASGGRAAVTTRSVSAAAGVQAPAIYRQFGDMAGLLEAVAARGFADYLERKRAQRSTGDPVADLRAGWDLHTQFALENPASYRLMYGGDADAESEAVRTATGILRSLVTAVAAAGRLTVDVERAVRLVLASNRGVALTLIDQPESVRDLGLSEQARDAVFAAITSDSPAAASSSSAQHAVALAAELEASDGVGAGALTSGERAILGELLRRIARG